MLWGYYFTLTYVNPLVNHLYIKPKVYSYGYYSMTGKVVYPTLYMVSPLVGGLYVGGNQYNYE
jgi:hypothetical protein